MIKVYICYLCSTEIPQHTPIYSGIRNERDRRGQWRKHPDFLVRCPRAGNNGFHPPDSSWNWVSKAEARGADWLRNQRAFARHQAKREKEA